MTPSSYDIAKRLRTTHNSEHRDQLGRVRWSVPYNNGKWHCEPPHRDYLRQSSIDYEKEFGLSCHLPAKTYVRAAVAKGYASEDAARLGALLARALRRLSHFSTLTTKVSVGLIEHDTGALFPFYFHLVEQGLLPLQSFADRHFVYSDGAIGTLARSALVRSLLREAVKLGHSEILDLCNGTSMYCLDVLNLLRTERDVSRVRVTGVDSNARIHQFAQTFFECSGLRENIVLRTESDVDYLDSIAVSPPLVLSIGRIDYLPAQRYDTAASQLTAVEYLDRIHDKLPPGGILICSSVGAHNTASMARKYLALSVIYKDGEQFGAVIRASKFRKGCYGPISNFRHPVYGVEVPGEIHTIAVLEK